MFSPHPLQPLGLDHLVLKTANPALMASFYVEVLGCSIEWARPDIGLIHLRAGASQIDLLNSSGSPGTGECPPSTAAHNVEHFCLLLSSADRQAVFDHLASHGTEIGEVSSRFGATGYGTSFYIGDPAGNRIEIKFSNV